jgi:anthranilate synthase component 1
MIRSILSKNNTLFYQAGAGVIIDSLPENELAEVTNLKICHKTRY